MDKSSPVPVVHERGLLVFAMAPDEQKERLPHTYQPPNWSVQ